MIEKFKGEEVKLDHVHTMMGRIINLHQGQAPWHLFEA